MQNFDCYSARVVSRSRVVLGWSWTGLGKVLGWPYTHHLDIIITTNSYFKSKGILSSCGFTNSILFKGLVNMGIGSRELII